MTARQELQGLRTRTQDNTSRMEAEIEQLKTENNKYKTRELEMRTYMEQQLQLLKRLIGHKQRLERDLLTAHASIEEMSAGDHDRQTTLEMPGGDRDESWSNQGSTSIGPRSISPRSVSPSQDIGRMSSTSLDSSGTSPGGGASWGLDYSSAPPECQSEDKAWIKQMARDPNDDNIKRHMQAVYYNAAHPLGSCMAEFTSSTSLLIRGLLESECPIGPEIMESIKPVRTFIEMMHQHSQTAFPLLRSEENAAISLPILENVVLSPIYDDLFALFQGVYRDEDDKYSRITSALSDATADQLGVNPKYLPAAEPSEQHGPMGRYTPAVNALRRIADVHSPLSKVKIITETCNKLVECSADAGSTAVMGADDTLPLLVYCVVKARIPYFASQIHYIEAFLLEEMVCGEAHTHHG